VLLFVPRAQVDEARAVIAAQLALDQPSARQSE
jgi:hypothetical protein